MPETTIRSPSSDPELDLSRAFTFFLEDPNWVPKLLVGTLFALLCPFVIGAVFLAGYVVILAKQTMGGRTPVLPEWDDLSEILVDGLKAMAISITHKLPLLVLALLLFLAIAGGGLLVQDQTLSEDLLVYGVPAIFGGWFLLFVVFVATLAYVPAAFTRFVQSDRLGAAFEVTENFAFIREHASTYLSALLAIVLAGFIGQLGIVVFCIGVFPAMVWSAWVMGYVIGELARLDGKARRS